MTVSRFIHISANMTQFHSFLWLSNISRSYNSVKADSEWLWWYSPPHYTIWKRDLRKTYHSNEMHYIDWQWVNKVGSKGRMDRYPPVARYQVVANQRQWVSALGCSEGCKLLQGAYACSCDLKFPPAGPFSAWHSGAIAAPENTSPPSDAWKSQYLMPPCCWKQWQTLNLQCHLYKHSLLLLALIKMYELVPCPPGASLICSREHFKEASQPWRTSPPYPRGKHGPVTEQPQALTPMTKHWSCLKFPQRQILPNKIEVWRTGGFEECFFWLAGKRPFAEESMF